MFDLLMRLLKEAEPKGLLERQDGSGGLPANLCPLYPLASALEPCIDIRVLLSYFLLL